MPKIIYETESFVFQKEDDGYYLCGRSNGMHLRLQGLIAEAYLELVNAIESLYLK